MAMELRELSRALLESQVTVVDALGRLVATVAGPEGDVLLAVSPRSLHKNLEAFRYHLRDTLGHHGDTALGDTLAALGATPGPSWAHVTSAAGDWRRSVAAVADRWAQLATEAARLRDACGAVATGERQAAATSSERAGDLRVTVKEWESRLRELVATALRVPVVTNKAEEKEVLNEHRKSVEWASKELERAMETLEKCTVASSAAKAATKRGERAEAALGPLQGLVAACAAASALQQELSRRAGDIAATLAGTEAAQDVPEGLVATVAQVEQLWEASGRLFTCHLLGTLGDILMLLPSGPGGLGGPSGHTVAQRCQKAMEDIPRLLQ